MKCHSNNFCKGGQLRQIAFDAFCSDVGISSSSAINMFIKTVLREHRIPFSIERDPFYSDTNLQFIKTSLNQMNEGKVVIKTMAELEAMENA